MPILGTVILAAGKGTRMHSARPKVLQRLLEAPMLSYVYAAVAPLTGERTWTVVGHGADDVRAAFPEQAEQMILQAEQRGTGHALRTAWEQPVSEGVSHLLVINGDTPLLQTEQISYFLSCCREKDCDLGFISLTPADLGSFGRVVRAGGAVQAIVEAKDYEPTVHGYDAGEINAGIYYFRVQSIAPLLPLLTDGNKSGEFYITDLIGLAVARNLVVEGVNFGDEADLLGINSPLELAAGEERLRARMVEEHLRRGVLLHNPSAVRIGFAAEIAPGAEITGPCEIYGVCRVAAGARIASHCRLENTDVGEGATIHSFCHTEDARIGSKCTIGPYARLRPGAVLEEKSRAGNFVEIKKSHIGKGAKVNHLTYIGDAELGPGVNVGAGTITCNYDGVHKHQTRIEEGAFIGSNTALVAPVTIGRNALVGAGSVITEDVPEGHLGLARGRQVNMARKR
jgi:bifunctional UDP-N-acetylglucosamine pyrophosphorylase/glucosamine-1-phosphate N-acetyltransferase